MRLAKKQEEIQVRGIAEDSYFNLASYISFFLWL